MTFPGLAGTIEFPGDFGMSVSMTDYGTLYWCLLEWAGKAKPHWSWGGVLTT